jgi:uncharacterized membrane protein YedE/YeeE
MRAALRFAVIAACGGLFALGLTIGGMTDPARVVAFLDFAGAWDPSLLFVMAGATGLYMAGYRAITRQGTPWFGGSFPARPLADLRDGRLVGGALLFGVGWGLAGYCPGPVWTAVGAGKPATAIVLAAMLVGIAVAERFGTRAVGRRVLRASATPHVAVR